MLYYLRILKFDDKLGFLMLHNIVQYLRKQVLSFNKNIISVQYTVVSYKISKNFCTQFDFSICLKWPPSPLKVTHQYLTWSLKPIQIAPMSKACTPLSKRNSNISDYIVSMPIIFHIRKSMFEHRLCYQIFYKKLLFTGSAIVMLRSEYFGQI